jgi:hypothetical protein
LPVGLFCRTRRCNFVIASEAKIPWGVDSDQV